MKTYKQYQQVVLECDEGYVGVVFKVEYSLENDGIGTYEFWGSQGFDHGRTYSVIENLTWDRDKHSPQENTSIEKYLEDMSNYAHLDEELCKRLDEGLIDMGPDE